MKNRTGIDFSKHEVLITRQEGLLIHHLKKPDTVINNIKFINTNGILAVTGDFGNWIFCREFHPTADGGVSDYYWLEKLHILSSQKGEEYSSEETEKELKRGIRSGLRDYGYKGDELKQAKEFYKECITHVDEEWDYIAFAHGYDKPDFIDHEQIPMVEITKQWLRIIFDGFDEICNRMKLGIIPE